jgi:hypothetical protein
LTNLKKLISLLVEVVELVEDVDVVDDAEDVDVVDDADDVDDVSVPKLKQQNNFLVLSD